jgi:regulator of sigma E protease
MNYLVYILAFVLILGAAVVIHEFGHFIVAKLFKIRVETFSVGFGPRLFGFRRGQTDYRVSAIPLGGYVKLGGDESNAPLEGAGAIDIPPEEQFSLRPKWQKILVALAGPVMNILTAFTIPFAGALMFGAPVTPPPVVSRVMHNGAAEAAGLKPGDRIVSFNGAENPTWRRIQGDAALSPEQPLPLVVEREGQRIPLTITPTKRKEGTETIGDLDLQPDFGNVPVVLTDVEANTPAEEAGLKAGDRVIAVNDTPVGNSEQLVQYVREHKGEPIRLTIARDGEQKEVVTKTRQIADGTDRLGIKPADDLPRERVGVMAAAAYSINQNLDILRLTGKALGQLFTGQRSARDTISGPIGIARASSTAVREAGLGGAFAMLSFLSLSLGIFNLLPIPVLDGGAIFLLLLEGALGLVGLTLSVTVRERIQQVGFVMVLLLMVLVITNDLMKEVASFRGGSNDNKPAASEPAK